MSFLDKTLSIIAPHSCLVCTAEGPVLCRMCALTLPTLPSICYVCGRATKDNTACSMHTKQFVPQQVFIAMPYEHTAKDLMHAYKFDYKRSAAKDIAMIMYENLPVMDDIDIVSYVPITGKHVRERGFHTTKCIAIELGKLLKKPVVPTLDRFGSTMQKGASRTERKKQLKGVYRALDTAIGKNILLVDDVLTTGATVEACSEALYRSGASSVSVAIFARTP